MADIYYLICTPTLKEIADAAKESNIQTAINITDDTDQDLYFVLKDTLAALADKVRESEGTTALIPVLELAGRIKAMTENDGSQDDGNTDAGTSAILGVAVLGKAILGNSVMAERLATPTIYLSTVDGDIPVLATPVIELVADDSKLGTPVISLVSIEGSKLATPTIYLDTVTDSDEGDDDMEEELPALSAPVIELITTVLTAPIIELVEG